jgi:signal transduction histidine kinase
MRSLFGLRFNFSTGALVAFVSISAFCQETYHLKDTSLVHRLDKSVTVFIDSTDLYGIDQILGDTIQSQFTPSKGNLTFGYLKSSLWLKVVTHTSSPRTHWCIEIPAPFLEYVDFYQQQNNKRWHHSQAGYYRAHSVKEISHTGFVLPLYFNKDSVSTVYIRIAGQSPKTFPLLVIEKEKFNADVRFADLGYGVFFGILIVMFFYNLFIYLTLKQINYLLYISTIVCTFLIFAGASGYGGKFLWPENPNMNFYAGRMTLPLLTIVLSIFTIRFLEVVDYSRFMYNVLLSLIPLAIIAGILMATETLSSAGNNLISVSTIAFMTTGIVCSVNGNKAANYFIAAWAIYLIGGLLLTLRNSGVLDFNFWTTHFVEIGAILETVIIAFALGDRYRRYKQEKEAAQWHALKLQLGANERLERKVKERTEQLSLAYQELHDTLETNKEQTKVIENKNAELDAFFYRISHDLKGPISSLLGLSALANREIKDAQAKEYMEKQQHQVERLNHIITGLINLTRLNHTELQKEKIDFDKIIDGCIVSLNGLPGFTSINFKKDIQDGIEFHSVWTLLNAILQNLIENGIKYSRQEFPYVHIKVWQESEWTFIEVADNGQGIHADHQSRIFEMFYRASQHASGTGLGLYILKRSVDRLQGVINMESTEGAGSTFTVKLPS